MFSILFNTSSRSRRGFTLTELLTTLALLGILFAVAMPSVSRSTGSHRVVEQTRRIHADLVEARSRAIAEQRRYRVQFFNSGSWRTQYETSPGTWAQLGTTRTLPSGFTLLVEGETADIVHYETHGRVPSAKTIVVRDDRGHDQRMEVGNGGMIEWFADP